MPKCGFCGKEVSMPETMRAIREITGMNDSEIESMMDGKCYHGECVTPSGVFN